LCNDKICELSDISFGDAWHLSNSKIGESIIVSRSRISEELLEKATTKKELELKKVSSKEIVESQGLALVKRQHKARILIFKQFGKRVPVCNQEALESKTSDYVNALLFYLRNYASSKPYLWNLINIYPFLLARIKGLHNI
jgi:coenzyme F420-reducing hydrogenase beta subunit